MSRLCLFCGKPLSNDDQNYHSACVKKMFGTNKLPELNLDEDKIIDENLTQGDTITGVQKKFSLNLSVQKSRKTVSVLNNEYIIKTPQEDLKNIVIFEWVGMKLAKMCGVDIVDCGLLKINNDFLYITKRIDRKDNKKIPMEDFCQLSNTQTEYKYNGSYEKCYKNVIQKYSDFETIDKIKFYRLLLFSYIIGNTDMHLKNFSLYEIEGKYQLTPAYDLVPVLMVFNQEDMALSLHGKTRKLTKKDFYTFGEYLGISKRIIEQIHNDIYKKQFEIIDFIDQTPLDEEEKDKFKKFISKNIDFLCPAPVLTEASKILKNMQEVSLKNGNYKMTLDEINEEIRLSRLERKQRNSKK